MKKFTVAACLLLLSLLLTVGVAFAHYERSSGGTLNFDYSGSQQSAVEVLPEGGWQEDADGRKLSFVLVNRTSESVNVRIRVVASLGAGDELDMVLTMGGKTYQAETEPILEGSDLYRRFGAGWIYYFPVNAELDQAQWLLASTDVEQGSLSVAGAPVSESLLHLEVLTQ